jgi:hypothetical protein
MYHLKIGVWVFDIGPGRRSIEEMEGNREVG